MTSKLAVYRTFCLHAVARHLVVILVSTPAREGYGAICSVYRRIISRTINYKDYNNYTIILYIYYN